MAWAGWGVWVGWCILKRSLPAQVTLQEMVSRVGKAYSAPLQPPHVEALRHCQEYGCTVFVKLLGMPIAILI